MLKSMLKESEGLEYMGIRSLNVKTAPVNSSKSYTVPIGYEWHIIGMTLDQGVTHSLNGNTLSLSTMYGSNRIKYIGNDIASFNANGVYLTFNLTYELYKVLR